MITENDSIAKWHLNAWQIDIYEWQLNPWMAALRALKLGEPLSGVDRYNVVRAARNKTAEA